MHTDRLSSLLRAVAAPVVAAAFLTLSPSQAHAQTAEEDGAVSGTAKGIVGGAFLGAEIVMMPMGIAGLKPWWPYVVFGGVGAVGGAVGGWAVEQADPPAEAPLYMLAGGLALIIPTLVLTLNATTREEYEGEEGTTTVVPPGTEPAPGTPPPGESVTTVQKESKLRRKVPRNSARRPTGFALFNFSGPALEMGVPAVQVRPTFSEEEIAKFGVQQENEVHLPVISASF